MYKPHTEYLIMDLLKDTNILSTVTLSLSLKIRYIKYILYTNLYKMEIKWFHLFLRNIKHYIYFLTRNILTKHDHLHIYNHKDFER